MNQRLYSVEKGENAIDISNVSQMTNALAKFKIKGEFHAINDQWNGINQGDLEGYVLCKEDAEMVYYKMYGFGEDSKVDLDNKWLLKGDNRLQSALLLYCDGYDPLTNKKLSPSEIEKIVTL